MASVEAGPEASANWTEEFLSLVQADREEGLVPASEAYKQVSSSPAWLACHVNTLI